VRIAFAIALTLPCARAATAPPPIVRGLNTSPDRGNREGASYVTGPSACIARLHNEDLEISYWRGPRAFTFSLAKNDVWDRRYFAAGKRIISIDDVRRRCFSVAPPKPPRTYPGYGGLVGLNTDLGLPNSPQALYRAYDFPCPKPVGQLVVRCADLKTDDRHVAGWADGDVLVAQGGEGKRARALWGVLHKTRNLLALRFEGTGVEQAVQVELYRHKDTTPQNTTVPALVHRGGKTGYDYTQDAPGNGPLPDPEAGTDGDFFWVRQRFHAEQTFPNGFEYVMMGLIGGTRYETRSDSHAVGAGEKATLHPIEPEAYGRMAGWLRQKRLAIERLNDAEYGALATATVARSASTFDLVVAVVTSRDADDPFAEAKRLLLDARQAGADAVMAESRSVTDEQAQAWRNTRVMHYNATSCTYADVTPWHGDYHFNEGHFLPAIVQGSYDHLEQRLRMFEEMLPALRRNAREVYKCGGIAFPLVHYPIKNDRVVYANVTWEWGIENTAFMLQPFWRIYQYTQDEEFLRTRAYPLMREAADFYVDYVTKGDDGRYHVVPTVSQEHWGFTPEFKLNRDSVGALSFVRYHLNACIEASKVLRVDADARPVWHEIVENLAPYPTLDTPEGPVFCDVRDAPRLLNYNITANLVMTLWAEHISLDSPPALLEMAQRSYDAIPDKKRSMRRGYLSRIRLYLGMLKGPSLCPQGRVLSWPGRIHLYAGVPKGLAINDQFQGHLAVGGFEVAAMHMEKTVGRVRIKSLAGRTCKVKSPWHPAPVEIVDTQTKAGVPHRMDRDTIVFDTQAGRTYALLPPEELRLARMQFVAEEKVVGRWNFDGSEQQVGGKSDLVDGATLAPGREGLALSLPSVKSYARVERTPAFDFGPYESFSVEAWVKIDPAQNPGRTPIVCSMALRQYCLLLHRGRPRFYLSSPSGSVYSFVDGKSCIANGRWHHVRGVRDRAAQTLKLYVDGALDGEAGDRTAGDFCCKAPITIGAYLWGEHSSYAVGQFDDIVIKSLGRLVPGEGD